MGDPISLRSGLLEVGISPLGAEMVRLSHAGHGEMLWSGDPAWWARTSPILFPVVGRSRDDRIVVDGRAYPMPLHGFAHASRFEVVEASGARCRLALSDSAATRVHYPFAFRLEIEYRLDGAALSVEATVGNPGSVPLPASLGFHPGFRWPLRDGLRKPEHFLDFADDDFLDVQRAGDGYILPETTRLPLQGRRLWLDEAHFRQGAMVIAFLKSRRVTFGARGTALSIQVGSENLPMLGLWMRPGADFLCIEPWSGHGDRAGLAVELCDRPGMAMLEPGGSRRHRITIVIGGEAPAGPR
ncbi:MAG: aldose 1-epimerase family protein [Mesorhizobium sp.]|nr:aldose 1-epimerase family protein [Mesorhizobium sp.]